MATKIIESQNTEQGDAAATLLSEGPPGYLGQPWLGESLNPYRVGQEGTGW
jgi:hypothetical protein